jgi:predicted aminopeptidase
VNDVPKDGARRQQSPGSFTFRRRAWRWIVRGMLAAVAALVLFAVATPMGRYLARAGWAEARILWRRHPIAALAADPATDAKTRGKLGLVLAARGFAADSLHLTTGESFTTYSALDRDTLVLVVSAAYRDTLAFHTWWFPVVGSVPYKGYFHAADALAEAASLEREGYDTIVRPASAFSTLGWFNDPLLSTTLAEDSASLANTVIHELLHNTFYAPGSSAFNESFANFVGSRGAERFFMERGDSVQAAKERLDWEREKFLGRFWSGVYHAVDSAFKAHPGDRAARLAARDTVFARTRIYFERDVKPNVPGLPPGAPLSLRLDNVTVMSRRLYRTGLDDFDAVYAREGNDLNKAIARIIALARSRPKEPFAAVREWVGSAGAEAPAQQRP